jgi:hypothetical protein
MQDGEQARPNLIREALKGGLGLAAVVSKLIFLPNSPKRLSRHAEVQFF